MTQKNTQKNRKKIAGMVLAGLAALFFLVLMPVMSVLVYEENFGGRFETPEASAFSAADFEGLQVENTTFASDDGQMLAGYHYRKDGQPARGVIVLSHGFGGGGHNSYMDVIDRLVSGGFLVFAYDATGNDRSEGDTVRGLPQGVADLDFALQYVKEEERYRDLPVLLFGHSWGAYAAGSVLQAHPDAAAAVLVSGFNASTGMFAQEGAEMIGSAIRLFMPYVSLYERVKFGAYAGMRMDRGTNETPAEILVIYSADDDVVDPAIGSKILEKRFADDDRFTFVRYTDRGHNPLAKPAAAGRPLDEEIMQTVTRFYETAVEKEALR